MSAYIIKIRQKHAAVVELHVYAKTSMDALTRNLNLLQAAKSSSISVRPA